MTSSDTVRSLAHAQGAAHRRAVAIGVADLVEFLAENLGAGLVALLADVDPQTVRRWCRDGARPRGVVEARLRGAYQVFQLLLPHEAPATIRAWFMGMNPQLGDDSPAEAIGADRLRDVMAAGRAFAAGG